MSKNDLQTIKVVFDLRPIRSSHEQEDDGRALAKTISELAAEIQSTLSASQLKWTVQLTKESGADTAKGIPISTILEVGVGVGVTARSIKPLIESITALLSGLAKFFPQNEFNLTLPDGSVLRGKGRIDTDEFRRLEQDLISRIRDTDLSHPQVQEYKVSIGPKSKRATSGKK
jgi:hypothetical protein